MNALTYHTTLSLSRHRLKKLSFLCVKKRGNCKIISCYLLKSVVLNLLDSRPPFLVIEQYGSIPTYNLLVSRCQAQKFGGTPRVF